MDKQDWIGLKDTLMAYEAEFIKLNQQIQQLQTQVESLQKENGALKKQRENINANTANYMKPPEGQK